MEEPKKSTYNEEKYDQNNKIYMKWIEALKKFNARKGEWCVPKKGTREHKEVLSIMQGATVSTNTRSEQAKHARPRRA